MKNNLLNQNRLKTMVLGLCMAIVPSVTQAQTPGFQWANSLGGTSVDMALGTAVDAANNVYTVGRFQGTADFDPGTGTLNLNSLGNEDVFITKQNSAGALVWAKQIGGTFSDFANAVAVDASGAVYVTGSFQGTVDFNPNIGTNNLTSAGSQDIFILKLDTDGNFVWARSMGSTSFDAGNGIKVDAAGQVLTVGRFDGSVDFDPGIGTNTLTSAGGSDIFVLKMDANGNALWARRVGGISVDYATSVATDNANAVFLTGTYQGTVDFDPGAGTANLTASGNSDIFALKLDASGNHVWSRSVGGTSFDEGLGIAVDQTFGLVHIIGYFEGTADFDPGAGTANLVSAGSRDIFICKLSELGNYLWAKRFGGTGFDEGLSIALDASLSVYTTGYFEATVDFNPNAGVANLTSAGGDDVFISKLDAGGNYVWAYQMGGSTDDRGNSITVVASNVTYVAGNYTGTVDFNPGSGTANLTSVGNVDVFIQKLCGENAVASITANPSGNVCRGTSVTLTATGGTSFLWSDGSTTSSITVAPNNTTSYSVLATGVGGCNAAASNTVFVTQNPSASIAPATAAVCIGQSITLTGSGGTGYSWNTGATSAAITVSPTTNTTYTLTVTNAAGCSTTVTKTVTVNSLPTVSITGNTAICVGGTTNLSPSSGGFWTPSVGGIAQVDNLGNVQGVTPGTATFTYTDANGCSATTNAVTVNAGPAVSISPVTASVCNGQAVTLTASGANSYSWSTGATTASITVTPTSNTTYSVTGTGANGCTTTTNRLVTVDNGPTVGISPGTATICSGQSVTLTASGGTSYAWSNGASTASITVSPTTNTTYTVTATNASGCSTTSSRLVTVNASPMLAINASGTTVCAGQTASLTASGADSYFWNTGATTAAINITPPNTANYIVTGTNANGCTATANQTITVNSNPTAFITQSLPSICAGQSITLAATGGTTYSWSTGATTNAITVSPTTGTTYSVTVTDANGCSAGASRIITPLPAPTITINPSSATVCSGQSVTLTASGTNNFSWSTGSTNATINVNPTTTTNYTVTGTGSNGCSASTTATVNVTVAAPITITTQPVSQTACVGNSVTLSVVATGGSLTYQWRKGTINIPGETNATLTLPNVAPADAGNYSVVISSGCASTITSQTATLTVTNTFVPVANGLVFHIPFDGNSTERVQNAPNTGFYTFTGTNDRFGNTNGAAQFVGNANLRFPTATQIPAGNAPYTVSTWIFVPNSDWDDNNGIYGWGTNFNNQRNALRLKSTNPGPTGYLHYWYANDFAVNTAPTVNNWLHIVITWNGTQQTFYQNGVVIGTRTPTQQPNITANDLLVGASDNGELFKGAMDDFRIYNRAITASEVTDLFTYRPLSTVNLAATQTICEGQTFAPFVSVTGNGFLTYQWNFNNTPITDGGDVSGAQTTALQIANVQQTNAGNYTLRVTQGNCVGMTSTPMALTVNPSSVTITNQPSSVTVCQGQPITLSAAITGTATGYQWLKNGNPVSGQTTATLSINTAQLTDAGNYTLEITGSCGTITTQTAVVTVNPNLSIVQHPQPVSGICTGGNFTLSVTVQGSASGYQWYLDNSPIAGATQPVYAVSNASAANAGSYTVVVNAAGCGTDITSLGATVQIETAPVFVTQPSSNTYCQNDLVNLSVSFSNAVSSMQWTYYGTPISGATGTTFTIPSIQPADAGNYVVFATNSCGDSYSSIIGITVNPSNTIQLNETICSGSSFNFNGMQLTQTGTYTQILTNTFGCDSTFVLNLQVLPNITNAISATICDGQTYTLGSQQLTSSGTFTETLPAFTGCDSTVTLQLTVITPGLTFPQAATICDGNTYTFGSQTLTQSGVYTETFTSQAGCDSIVELTLTVNALPVATVTQNGNTLTATPGFTSYLWYFNGQPISNETNVSITPQQEGTYYVEVTDAQGCSDLSNTVTFQFLSSEQTPDIQIHVYPNPTPNEVWITGSITGATLTVLDMTGRIIATELVQQNPHRTVLNNLADGYYLLRIVHQSQVFTYPILKKGL